MADRIHHTLREVVDHDTALDYALAAGSLGRMSVSVLKKPGETYRLKGRPVPMTVPEDSVLVEVSGMVDRETCLEPFHQQVETLQAQRAKPLSNNYFLCKLLLK